MSGFSGGQSIMGRGYASYFPATENPISEGSHWVNGQDTGLKWQNARIVAGQAYGTQTGNGNDGLNTAPNKYDDTTAVLSGSWTSNQQAIGILFNNEISGSWNSEVELLLRFQTTANSNRGYEFNTRVKAGAVPYVEIIRWNGAVGDFTQLVHIDSNNFALVTGDRMRATAVGHQLTLYHTRAGFDGGNGTGKEYAAATYSTLTGDDGANDGFLDTVIWSDGNPGMGFYLNNQGATGDPSRYGWTYFAAQNLL